MDRQEEQNNALRNRYGVWSMWVSWALSVGALIVALLLPLMVSKVVCPLYCLGLSALLYVSVRLNRQSQSPVCTLMPFVMSRVMFFSSIVMLMINVMHKRHYIDLVVADVELLNPEIPYIMILILGPMTVLMCSWVLLRGPSLPLCVDCVRQYGNQAERGFLGDFQSREGKYQVKTMLWMMAGLTVAAYLYYFIFYINVNLNSPDIFVFNVAPSLLLCVSILMVGMRYLGVWHFFRLSFGRAGSQVGRVTKLRFLIVSGEKMLLDVPSPEGDIDISDFRIDTPVTLSIRRRDVTLEEASTFFENITDIKNPDIRFLYSSYKGNSDSSIFHYLVELPSSSIPDGARLKGEWFTIREVGNMLNAHALTPLLAAEIVRMHNVALAWKTYDRRGMRRYQIRNYRPAFRISDLANREIDYNDPHWLYIADNNEDKPFFRIRHLWSRHVSGSMKHDKSARER